MLNMQGKVGFREVKMEDKENMLLSVMNIPACSAEPYYFGAAGHKMDKKDLLADIQVI